VDRSEVRDQREKADAPLPLAAARNRLADVVNPPAIQADPAVIVPTPVATTPAPLPNRLPTAVRAALKRKSR